ncbi:MAG TPA: tetratricopeptide repeat protein, partial [Pirellulaceae bacterium]|nr:tetratricopeptide repeat protein [Pirellulaceae bacterium]
MKFFELQLFSRDNQFGLMQVSKSSPRQSHVLQRKIEQAICRCSELGCAGILAGLVCLSSFLLADTVFSKTIEVSTLNHAGPAVDASDCLPGKYSRSRANLLNTYLFLLDGKHFASMTSRIKLLQVAGVDSHLVITHRQDKTASELFDIAAAHYSRDAWQLAVQAFEELRLAFPDSPFATKSLFYLGEAFVQLKQFERALQAFQQYIASSAEGEFLTRCQFRVGECLYLLERDAQALRVLQDFVFEHPADELLEAALPLIARLRVARSEPQMAQRTCEIFIEKFPSSKSLSECQFLLAKSLIQQGELNEAARHFRALAERNEFDRIDTSLFELARISFSQDFWKESKGWLDRLIANFPTSEHLIEAKLLLAKIYLAEGNPQAAEHVLYPLDHSDAAQPFASAIWIERARTKIALGKPESAHQWLEHVIATSDHDYWLDAATQLIIQIATEAEDWRRVRNAAENYRKRNLQGFNFQAISIAEGVAAYKLGDLDGALKVFQQLVQQIDPSEFQQYDRINYWLAVCELKQGDADAALDSLSKIALFSEDGKFQAAVTYVRAMAYITREQLEPALAALRQYLILAPAGADSFTARKHLVAIISKIGDIAEADQVLAETLELQPADHCLELAALVAYHAAQRAAPQIANRWYQYILDRAEPGALREQAITGLAFLGTQIDQFQNSTDVVNRLMQEIASGSPTASRTALPL